MGIKWLLVQLVQTCFIERKKDWVWCKMHNYFYAIIKFREGIMIGCLVVCLIVLFLSERLAL